jgi:hypothetical protein
LRAELRIAVVEYVPTLSQTSGFLVDRIASHLRHPGFGGVSGNAGEGNAPRIQVEKEEDVIRNETTPGQDLNGEEVCSGKDGHVGGDEVLDAPSFLNGSANAPKAISGDPIVNFHR